MSDQIGVKICGVKTPADLVVAADSGARYVGLNFFDKSPRFVSVEQAQSLCRGAPHGILKVGLVVDASDAGVDQLLRNVALDALQLHGSETPERVLEIKNRFDVPIIKAIGISDAGDLKRINLFGAVADQLLVDAKPPIGAALPGGNGVTFDWSLIAGVDWAVPWLLAGGLTSDNVGQAIRESGADQVDVSSAVEKRPGEKDPDSIRAFCAAAIGLPVR